MDQKSYNLLAGAIFAAVALAHVTRLYMGWPVFIDTWAEPTWLSWLGFGVGGVPVYISAGRFEAWRHTQFILDVVPGRGGMFSLDNGTERRFLSRASTFSSEEICALPVPARTSSL
jgi:hypothetical protein